MKEKKVILLVNIPTHLNVVQSVSSLLHASNEFTPTIMFCNVAVLNQCRHKLRDLPNSCFVWTGESVVSVREFIGQNPSTPHLEKLENAKGEASLLRVPEIYPRLLKICPLLPSYAQLNSWIRKQALRVVHFMRITSSILQMLWLTGCISLNKSTDSFGVAFGKRHFINRLLLAHFGNKWRDAATTKYHRRRGVIAQLTLIMREGILRGITDQKNMQSEWRCT